MDNRENVRKESKKAVLIIIPAYNRKKTIYTKIKKINRQKIKNLQILK